MNTIYFSTVPIQFDQMTELFHVSGKDYYKSLQGKRRSNKKRKRLKRKKH